MNIPSRPALVKCLRLLALISLIGIRARAADLSAQTNDQLLAKLQDALMANPSTKARGEIFASSISAAYARGEFLDLERALVQTKVQLSSDPDAVAAIELLLVRFEAAEAAATTKRNAEVDAIVKDLTDKFNAHAPPKDYDLLLKRISDAEAALSSPYGASRDAAGARRLEDARSFAAGWQNYLVEIQNGIPLQAASELSQLVQLTSRFTAIPRSTLLELQVAPGTSNEAAAKKEMEDQMKADQFAAKISAEIDSAKLPRDLDSALNEIASQGKRETQPPRGYMMSGFVRKWQDYLAAVQSGSDFQVKRILQELAGNNDATFYPRSKILAREMETGGAAGRAKPKGAFMDPSELTLDNLKTLSAQIDAFGDAAYLFEHGESSLRSAVGHLASAFDQVKSGDLKSGVLATQYNGMAAYTIDQVGDYAPALNRLYEEVSVIALPGYIDIPADLKPFPQERLASYIDRVINSAISAQDWRLAFRAAQVRSQIGPAAGNPDVEMADYLGFRSMITGLDKEEASQWTDAVSSYLDALNSTSPHLPFKDIGVRLLRIQKEHPDDYAKAKTQPDYPGLVTRLMEMQRNRPAPTTQRPTSPLSAFPGQQSANGAAFGVQAPGNVHPPAQSTPSN